ncbi:bacterial transcriptional activator domain-containing protein [Haloechinothrix salitolerans]|uniref:Bacterial transcriptional activator domain-containing protein n=1 Tax=Haloechinothrix salitolerans TaxID=926830 RepID=A0ABW2CA67_9PSEU
MRDYHAKLAPDLDEAWLEAEREHLHQQVIGAMRALMSCHDEYEERKLATLDAIRALDPTNEALYREIIRTQARLGRHDAIDDTLDLLKRELDKLDERPSSEILQLARSLRSQQYER